MKAPCTDLSRHAAPQAMRRETTPVVFCSPDAPLSFSSLMTRLDPRGLRRLLGAVVGLALSMARPLADQPFIIASHDQAYVGHDVSSRVWTIGSGHFEVAIGFDDSNRLTLQHLWDPQSGREWEIGETPDIAVTLGGQRVPLQTSAT